MKKVLISIQNGLMSEAITRLLQGNGEFQPFRMQMNQHHNVVEECKIMDVDILLMEVSYAWKMTLDVRLEEIKQIRKTMPQCKIVILCDENSSPDIANDVIRAKRDGMIDTFLYSSVTERYLIAILSSL